MFNGAGTPFDLVFLDLTIPGGMGGQEAAQNIKAFDKNAKIVVTSGYATDPVMANFQDYNFVERVEKPYQFSTLKSVIQRVLAES